MRIPGLAPGDLVGVSAPAYPLDASEVAAGRRVLEELGYRVRIAGDPGLRRGYLAGDDDRRAAALNELIGDDSVRAILFARGGYGTGRILDRIDMDGLRRRPRLLVGYSDLTALFLALQRGGAYPVGYGPHLADLARGRFQERSFRRVLREGPGGDRVKLRREQILVPGRAQGLLQGGCLTLLQSSLGTPWQPDLRGCLLFWEDCKEEPYRIDRMLNHLRVAGVLEGIAGMIVGRPQGIRPRAGRPSLSLPEVLMDHAGGLGVPLVLGIPAGHLARKITLSLGVPARIDTDAGLLETLPAPG